MSALRRLRLHRGLWSHRDFMRLWGAQTISQFGSQITFLALPIAAIVVLEASAFEVAVLGALEWAPWLLFSLPVGAWVDRVLRKPILILADIGRALVLLSVPLAYGFDALTIWQLYAVGFATGVLTVFFDVAYQSYLPSVVERDQLEEGNSKLEISRSGAQLGVPAWRVFSSICLPRPSRSSPTPSAFSRRLPGSEGSRERNAVKAVPPSRRGWSPRSSKASALSFTTAFCGRAWSTSQSSTSSRR
jgi:hypothetical protein